MLILPSLFEQLFRMPSSGFGLNLYIALCASAPRRRLPAKPACLTLRGCRQHGVAVPRHLGHLRRRGLPGRQEDPAAACGRGRGPAGDVMRPSSYECGGACVCTMKRFVSSLAHCTERLQALLHERGLRAHARRGQHVCASGTRMPTHAPGPSRWRRRRRGSVGRSCSPCWLSSQTRAACDRARQLRAAHQPCPSAQPRWKRPANGRTTALVLSTVC